VEFLEPRAAPGAGVLELLFVPPLLEPFCGSLWADSNPSPDVSLLGLSSRNKDRLVALASLREDERALGAVVSELRAVLSGQAADQAMAELYVSTVRERLTEVADALANQSASLATRPFLSRLWWVDEVFTALGLARDGVASGVGGAVDLPPVARDDEFSVVHDAVLQVGPVEGVLANDFDPTGQSLSVTLAVPPVHAARFELRGDGSFVYEPQPGYQGPDSFVYRVTDGRFTDDGTAELLMLGDPPVAQDDTAYTGPGEPPTDQLTIAIYVLQNDTGQGIMVTSVGQPSHGTASGYGYNVYYTPGPTFGCAPGKSSTDRFTYTIRDSYGQTASATVTVNAVEVTGYTVQWQKPDETWQALGEDDVSWVGDQLRWTPQYSFDPQYFAGSALWRKPYSEPSGWVQFATGGAEVFTGADMGEWAVQAQVRFAGMPWQSGFAARQETQGHRLTAEIASIQWTDHSNPEQAGDLEWFGSDIMHIFPDASAPGGGACPKVDVLINVTPAMAGITVQTRLRDVDDPDHDGPVDTTDPPAGQTGLNQPDNFSAGGGIAPLPPFPTFGVSDANGQVRLTLDMQSIQPGNNFRIAAGGRAERLDRVKPLAPSDDARLFYDKNNNTFEQGPDEVWMEASTYHMGIRVTPRLIVWRKLHVEADSMSAEVDNCVETHSGMAYLWHDGNYAVPVTGNLEFNRFENGQLFDGVSFFTIESNTESVVIVTWAELPPHSDVDITLWDDDVQTMPEVPNLVLMELAYEEASIYPVLDGGGDPTNNKQTVPFEANILWRTDALLSQIEAPGGLESHGNRSDAFWIAYVQAAFQPNIENDRDPDSEFPWMGGTPDAQPNRGSLVFLETARDVARSLAFTPEETTLYLQRHVVHETAHQFGVDDEQGPAPSVMHYASVEDMNSAGGSRFNEHQLLTVRTRQASPGA
jgi:hypothetical protein